jgi:hypothetical protein
MSEQSKKSSLLGGIDIDHDYCVRIPFAKGDNTNIFGVERQAYRNLNNWNEACAKAIEQFGMPGDKYTCRFLKECMEFWFRDEKDAMMFELCCG